MGVAKVVLILCILVTFGTPPSEGAGLPLGSTGDMLLHAEDEQLINVSVASSSGHVNIGNKDYNFELSGVLQMKLRPLHAEGCGKYRTCSACSIAEEPKCGWCSTKQKCTTKGSCPQEISTDTRVDAWLKETERCPVILEVRPVLFRETVVLFLRVANFPTTEGFFCAFTIGSSTVVTNATRSEHAVGCFMPNRDFLIHTSRAKAAARLSVLTTGRQEIAATDYKFYDCRFYTSCIHCTASPLPCEWCVGTHLCTHDVSEHCRNDIVISGVPSSSTASIRSGPGQCPHISNSIGSGSVTLTPHGIQRRVRVKIENVPPFISASRFMCQFRIRDAVRMVNAQLLGDTIYCDAVKLEYEERVPNKTVELDVFWDGSKRLDNPEDIRFLVYRCEEMAGTCTECQDLPEDFGCGWCEKTQACTVRHQCHETDAKWLQRSATCPHEICDIF